MKLEKRNGIHIPQEIFALTDIDWTAKVLLSEIYHFNKKKTCFASNRHFAELLQITSGAASKQIKKLKQLNYISTSIRYENGKTIGRIIKYLGVKDTTAAVNNNQKTYAQNKKQLDKNSSTDNNPTIEKKGSSSKNHAGVPEQPEGTSPATNGVVPQQPEGSSSTTRGVLPERLEGSSSRNTNNTMNNTNKNNSYNKSFEIDQLIENIEEIIMHYSFISKFYVDRPDRLDDFKNSFRKYIDESYSLDRLLEAMPNILYGYSNWKNELLRLGFEQFIYRVEKYHDGYPDTTALMLATIIRTLQSERSEK